MGSQELHNEVIRNVGNKTNECAWSFGNLAAFQQPQTWPALSATNSFRFLVFGQILQLRRSHPRMGNDSLDALLSTLNEFVNGLFMKLLCHSMSDGRRSTRACASHGQSTGAGEPAR